MERMQEKDGEEARFSTKKRTKTHEDPEFLGRSGLGANHDT